ncbi:MAG TPA: hypothetical protein VH437_24790 [Terriglobales bacterium]|jgi:hypothetical protein
MDRRTALQLAAVMPFAFQDQSHTQKPAPTPPQPTPNQESDDWKKSLSQHNAEIYESAVVTLDNAAWTGCKFTGCIIRYGGGPLSLVNNHFSSCNFVYFDCAQRTVYFAQLMNQAQMGHPGNKPVPQLQEMNNKIQEN